MYAYSPMVTPSVYPLWMSLGLLHPKTVSMETVLPVVSGLQVGGAKVNDLHSIWLSGWIHQHNVFWFEVSMDKTQAFEFHSGCGYLLENWANIFERQGAKLVLF